MVHSRVYADFLEYIYFEVMVKVPADPDSDIELTLKHLSNGEANAFMQRANHSKK